jgi:O-antigen biosynthesis protein
MSISVPILMYHQVSPRPAPVYVEYTVTPKTFALQMTWLASAGYVPVSLDALLDYRWRGVALPPQPVIITFDDGFLEAIEYAVPALEVWGFTATFFLVAGYVGGTSRWDISEVGIEQPLIDWSTARALQTAGFHCEAHTMYHPRLPALSEEACRQELYDSRLLLEDHLGHEVEHLAYPHGSYDDRVQRIVSMTGYISACSTRNGLSGPDDDILALHRIGVSGYDSLDTFIDRLRTGAPLSDVTEMPSHVV